MAGLQRSSETFRRSGSSGTVWEDKHQLASGELTAGTAKPARRPKDAQQRQSGGSSGHGGYRTDRVQPALDPPSPRVAVADACCFCSLFGKDKHKHQPPRGARGKGRRR